MADLLEISRLTKRFGGLAAVNDVSFNVPEGGIVGLIGPNGAGKTTIFNLVTGIYSLTEGEVKFKGKSIAVSPEMRQAYADLIREKAEKEEVYGRHLPQDEPRRR